MPALQLIVICILVILIEHFNFIVFIVLSNKFVRKSILPDFKYVHDEDGNFVYVIYYAVHICFIFAGAVHI